MEFGSDWGGKDYYEEPKEKIREESKEKIEDRPQERKDDKSDEELKRKELKEKTIEQDEEEKRESNKEAEKKKKLNEEKESQKREENDERITKDEKDDRRQEELNDKDKEKVNDETKGIESEKIKEKIDDKEKEEVHEGITKKEIEEYRKETSEVFGDFILQMYLEEFSTEKKISANKGREIRPEFKEYIEKLDDGAIDPYRESLLEKCEAIKEKHLFDKFIIYILYNADNSLKFISNYERHTGLEISFGTIEKIAKENNIEIKIFAEPIHEDINEAEVSEIQILSIKNRELKKQILDLQETEHDYCNKIYNLEREKSQLEGKISELEKEKLEKEEKKRLKEHAEEKRKEKEDKERLKELEESKVGEKEEHERLKELAEEKRKKMEERESLKELEEKKRKRQEREKEDKEVNITESMTNERLLKREAKEEIEEQDKIRKEIGEEIAKHEKFREDMEEEIEEQEEFRMKTEERLKDFAEEKKKEKEEERIASEKKEKEISQLNKEEKKEKKAGNKFKPKREIRIKDYVDNVVGNYERSVKNNRSELKQLRIGKGYISNNSSEFLKVYKHRAKYIYTGIVYRVSEILPDGTPGRLIYGYTTESLETRWFRYKRYATNNNKKNRSIHDAIKNVIDSGRNPDQYFKREVIEIHFDDFLMRKREDYWIKKDKTQDPNRGFNTFSGGGGGKRIFLPTFSLSRLIAKGHTATDISKIFNQSKKYVSPKVVIKRVKENWGSMHNARLKFLKPVLKNIVNNGNSFDDIVRAFGIHGRHILERRIPELFNGMSYTELRRKCLKEKLEPLIIIGLSSKEMAKKLKWFGKKEIEASLKREWNGLNEARKQLLRPIIIEKLRNGQKIDDVLPLFGYSKSSIKKHKWRIVKHLFWGMTPQQVKRFFTEN